MKKYWLFLILIVSLLITLNSCENYVTDIDPLIDQVEDEQLNDQAEIPFVIVSRILGNPNIGIVS